MLELMRGIMTNTLEVVHTPKEIRQQLEGGYANLSFHLGNQACSELFANFKTVAEQVKPDENSAIVNALTFDDYGYGNSRYELDLRIPGAKNREDEGEFVRDHKYVLHYGPRSRSHAEAVLGTLPKDVETLLDNCEEFYQEGLRAAELGATALGINRYLFHPTNPQRNIHHLRLIDYISSDNSTHASPHFDRGTVTLAINESHPGLRGKPADNGFLAPLTESDKKELLDMDPIAHQENVAKFFASAGLRRLPERILKEYQLDQVPLLAHDVVNEKPGINRQAVVMFFNPHADSFYHHDLAKRVDMTNRRSKSLYIVPQPSETKIEAIT
jgi:hypothetical protein